MLNYDYNRDFKKYSDLRADTLDIEYNLFCSIKYDVQNKTEILTIDTLRQDVLYSNIFPIGYSFIELININIDSINVWLEEIYNIKILKDNTTFKDYSNNITIDDWETHAISTVSTNIIIKDVQEDNFINSYDEIKEIYRNIKNSLEEIASLHPYLIKYSQDQEDGWTEALIVLASPEKHLDDIISETDVLKKIMWCRFIRSMYILIENITDVISTITQYNKIVKLCLDVSNDNDWADIALIMRLYLAERHFNIGFHGRVFKTVVYLKIKNSLTGEKFPFDYDENYEKTLSLLQLKNIYKNYTAYIDEQIEASSIDNTCYISFMNMMKTDTCVKKCKNCDKYFIPQNRSDTLYCDNLAPQDTTKTCKEYGARKAYHINLNNNTSMKLYRNIYMAKQMLVKRNPDVKDYEIDFENFKTESKLWKTAVKQERKTQAEFIQWLNSVKGKRGATNGNDTEEE